VSAPPQRYRKKPAVIEAVQLHRANAPAVALWCGGVVLPVSTEPAQAIEIATLEGAMRAELGDWIIRGVHGEFYPCKPSIFAATYEPVEP
jgi:hypothetical protein